MSDSKKQQIINDIYFDRAGFGSKATTLKDAKEKDSSIKMSDVEEFFKKNVEIQRKQQSWNSFIAPHNKHTYQIDLTFFRGEDFKNKQKFYMALTCIDVLSKYAVAIPLKSKDAPNITAGVMEAIQKMGGKPKLIFTDDEGSLRGEVFREFVKSEGMELHRTRSKAFFVERFNRTVKDMLFKRIEADEKKGKENIQWVDYLPQVLLTYNNKNIHSATGLIPNEARKKDNEFKAKVHVAIKAKKNRIYPELDVGNRVKIMRKKRTGEKEKSSHWLKNEYTVEAIAEKLGQQYYKLSDYPRPLLRHELLKV